MWRWWPTIDEWNNCLDKFWSSWSVPQWFLWFCLWGSLGWGWCYGSLQTAELTNDKLVFVSMLLGYKEYCLHLDVVAIRNGAQFGENNTTIFLSDVSCSGNERNLLSCPHNSIGQHNCDISDTAGVICGGMLALDSGYYKFTLVLYLLHRYMHWGGRSLNFFSGLWWRTYWISPWWSPGVLEWSLQ